MGAISLTGILNFVQSAGTGGGLPLSQSMGGVAVSSFDVTVPPGATQVVYLPLTPVLFFAAYSPASVQLITVTEDSPAGEEKGLRGLTLHTYTKDHGLTAVSVANPSQQESVTLTVVYGYQAEANVPPYWE